MERSVTMPAGGAAPGELTRAVPVPDEAMDLSVVVPVLNEREALPA